jgi:hypothetical protein
MKNKRGGGKQDVKIPFLTASRNRGEGVGSANEGQLPVPLTWVPSLVNHISIGRIRR